MKRILIPVDGSERRHHRRHVDPGDGLAGGGRHLAEGGHDAVAPGAVHVVLERAGLRDPDLVGHPGPGEDGAVVVGGDGLDRRRPDVEAHGDRHRRRR